MTSPAESVSILTLLQPFIPVIVGGFLTFMGGVLGPHIIEKSKHKRDAKSLAFAFRGELIAIRAIVSRRRYLQGLQNAITHIKTTNQLYTISINVRQNYFEVYEKNVDKLGILTSPLPESIATFYTQAKSVLEDLETLRVGGFNQSTAQQVYVYNELYDLLYSSMKLIDSIVQEIETTYS